MGHAARISGRFLLANRRRPDARRNLSASRGCSQEARWSSRGSKQELTLEHFSMTLDFRRHLLISCLLASASVRAAEPIRPSPKLPETAPWNLTALAQPPEFEWIDCPGPVRALLYQGEPYGGQPTRVFAYYATPGILSGNSQSDKNLPAVVLIHGGGGTAFRDWVEIWAKRGYAAIAMDLAGSRPIEGTNAHQRENRSRLPVGGPGQGDDTKFGNIAQPVSEQWPYHAVAAAIRAHSLIRGFPEVDSSRTAVTGISWGGYLTCI